MPTPKARGKWKTARLASCASSPRSKRWRLSIASLGSSIRKSSPLSRDEERRLQAELDRRNVAIIARNPTYIQADISSGPCDLDGITLNGKPVGCDATIQNEKTRAGFTFIGKVGRERWINLMQNHRSETYVLRRLELVFGFRKDERAELGTRLPEVVAQTVQHFQ